MSMPGVCDACKMTMPVEATACPHCGSVPGGGVHPMSLMLWFLLILTIPIYPIAGTGALLGLLAVGAFFIIPGFPQILAMLLVLVLPVIAFFMAFKYERRAAFSRLYRILRYVLRWSAGLAIIAYVIFADTGLSGGEIFGVIVLVPLAILLTKLADIALDARGPIPPPKPPGPMLQFFYEAKGNEAVIYGFPAGVIGFLIGNDTRILFGLFCWAFVTGTILGVKFLFYALSGRVSFSGSDGKGGSLARTIWCVVLGAVAAGVLAQVSAGTVPFSVLFVGAGVGWVVARILAAFSRRRASN